MDTIPVDIEGLNLILGGGIPLLQRHAEFADKSATLLVRGPPGSGKTVFGTQLAGSLGRSLECDVAYGCVELLPSELAAQHAGIKRPEVKEQVVQAPFTKQAQGGEECRIFAGMLDIGSEGEEASRLAEAIGGLLEAIEEAGGKPRVLVIDSLSEGYHLGAAAPRALADDLCKMAARRGMVLILLEETIANGPSVWSFATDIALQLSRGEKEAPNPGSGDSFERCLTVIKNRFHPSAPGVHRFAIMPGSGITVLPHPRTYLSKWAPNVVLPGWKNHHLRAQGWSSIKLPTEWPSFQQCITAVYGLEARAVYETAIGLGRSTTAGEPLAGSDVLLDFGLDDAPIEPSEMIPGALWKIGCGDPYLGGDWLLATVIASIDALRRREEPVRRVLVGDLQSLRSFWSPEGIRHALGVLVAILRRVRVPAILFETSAPSEEGFVEPPRIVDFADVVIRTWSASPGQPRAIIVSHVRAGLQLSDHVV